MGMPYDSRHRTSIFSRGAAICMPQPMLCDDVSIDYPNLVVISCAWRQAVVE